MSFISLLRSIPLPFDFSESNYIVDATTDMPPTDGIDYFGEYYPTLQQFFICGDVEGPGLGAFDEGPLGGSVLPDAGEIVGGDTIQDLALQLGAGMDALCGKIASRYSSNDNTDLSVEGLCESTVANVIGANVVIHGAQKTGTDAGVYSLQCANITGFRNDNGGATQITFTAFRGQITEYAETPLPFTWEDAIPLIEQFLGVSFNTSKPVFQIKYGVWFVRFDIDSVPPMMRAGQAYPFQGAGYQYLVSPTYTSEPTIVVQPVDGPTPPTGLPLFGMRYPTGEEQDTWFYRWNFPALNSRIPFQNYSASAPNFYLKRNKP